MHQVTNKLQTEGCKKRKLIAVLYSYPFFGVRVSVFCCYVLCMQVNIALCDTAVTVFHKKLKRQHANLHLSEAKTVKVLA